MGPQRLVTFVISALEMFLLTYLLTYLRHVTLKGEGYDPYTPIEPNISKTAENVI